MKKELGSKARINRLQKYSDTNYGNYDDEVEFYVNPDDYTWKFYIPSVKRTITMSVDAYGSVSTTSIN